MRVLFLASILLIIACCRAQVKNTSDHQEHPDYIGTTYFTWEDTTRKDPDYGGKRIINVQVWYPTEEVLQPNKYTLAPYYYGHQRIWGKLDGWSKDDIQFVLKIQTNSIVDAPLTVKNLKYPLIIFSPGLGGNLSYYNHYAEYLSQHGYVVAGVNHLYESEFVLNKNNDIIAQNLSFHDSLKSLKIPSEITADEYRSVKGKRSKVLGEDLIFCIDMLSKTNSEILSNRIDFDRIGVWGHSFGGAAAIQACLLDDRYGAVLNIDGTPPTLDDSQSLNIPFMFIEDLTDYEQHDGLMKQYIRRDQFCSEVNERAFRILIGGISHSGFLDINYHSATEGSEKEKALQLLNKTSSYMLDFFDHALLNKKSALVDMKSDSLQVKVFE